MGKRKKGRRLRLPPEAVDALQAQREAFRQKFGRDPGPDDPILLDPDAAEPRPMTEDRLTERMVRALERAGVRPEIIHAYRRCGFLPTEEMLPRLTDEELAAWEAAITEYRTLEGRRT
jgi:integrase